MDTRLRGAHAKDVHLNGFLRFGSVGMVAA